MNIKRISALLPTLFLLAETTFGQVSYHISGTWPGGAGKRIRLEYFPAKTPESEAMDSATVDANGRFQMKGEMKEMQPLLLSNGERGYCPLMGDGKPVVVDITDVPYNYKHPSAAYQIKTDTIEHRAVGAILDFWGMSFLHKMSGGMASESLKRAIANHHTADSLKYATEIATAEQREEDAKTDFIARFGNCLAAPFFIEMNMLKEASAQSISDFYDRLGLVAKSSPKGVELKRDIESMLRLSPGAVAPDFTLTQPDGTSLTLSDLRGHVVLVDFWASWCGPCMAEMPTVKALYAKYRDKGLRVLGVSMDHVRGAWTKSIEKNNLSWLHVSSLKGMQKCPVAQLYQVYGIPQLYIIGKDGRIIAKNLRGEDLKQKIDELFGE